MKSNSSIFLHTCMRLGLGLALLITLCVVMTGVSPRAHAAPNSTLTVTDCSGENGPGQIGSVLNSAAAGDTITFSCSGTIPITSFLNINVDNLMLDGSGQNVILDGQNSSEVMVVSSHTPPLTFTLNALTITRGTGYGGGLHNYGGTVNITNSTFTNNSANGADAGAIYNDLSGTIHISNSTISNNSASGVGGGINNNGGTVTISNSTISTNTANTGGGGIFNSGTLNISNSTFTGNSASAFGGSGGGVFNNGTTTISNSTFAGNMAPSNSGGGLEISVGMVTISNSTFANNSASTSGGGFDNFQSGGTLKLSGSIVANNTAQTGGDCSGAVSDQGYNLDSDGSCGFANSNDLSKTDPKLDPNGLQSNGGSTQTIALLQGSPAIDWVASGCPSSDQRGNARPDDSEANCDIGAYESSYPDNDLGLANVPANMTVTTSNPQGTTVTYTSPTTTDENGDNPTATVSCSPPSGSVFPVGTTTVTCTATDSDDTNSPVSQTFTVTVTLTDNDLGLANMPVNITTNATSPKGATVTYTPPTATDESGDSSTATVTCSPTSSSVFPIGTTTVTCTATDSDDSNSPVSQSFTVTVNDTDLGLSKVPANITKNATNPSGAIVTFTSPIAVDEDSPLPPVTCSPASGSTFAIGTTTVNCSVSDSDDTPNSVSQSFTVTVKPVLALFLPTTVKATEGTLINRTVATGKAYGTVNPLTVTIDWGDGSSPTVLSVTPASDGSYSVPGTHTYAEEGQYTLTITVQDGGTLSAKKTAPVSIADAALKLHSISTALSGKTLTLKGNFSDNDPGAALSDYTATISWGDNSVNTQATLSSTSTANLFSYLGQHSYAAHGTYTVTITITDAGGSTILATMNVTV